METVTINNTKYNIVRRDNSKSIIGIEKGLKENQSLLWITKPNGKHVYMVFETIENNASFFGTISQIF